MDGAVATAPAQHSGEADTISGYDTDFLNNVEQVQRESRKVVRQIHSGQCLKNISPLFWWQEFSPNNNLDDFVLGKNKIKSLKRKNSCLGKQK